MSRWPPVTSDPEEGALVLRVLHVIGGGDTGGAMAHLLPLLGALRRQGCDARLLCLGSGGLAVAAQAQYLPVEVLPMAGSWDPRVLLPLRRRLLMTPWDIVHTHGMRANLPVRLLWPGVTRGRMGGRPSEVGRSPSARTSSHTPLHPSPSAARGPCLFTTVHSYLGSDYPDPLRRRLFPGLDRLTLGRVDHVVCVSEELRSRLGTQGLAAGRFLVIRSGVELEPAAPSARIPETPADAACDGSSPEDAGPADPTPDRDPAMAAAVWGSRSPEPGAPRVGTVARLVPVKDLDLFLDVVAALRSSYPALRAAVVGEGPERERLAARARSLGLDGVVTFSGDVRPGSRAVREFDVFLLTSSSEGIPMTLLEAMAAGVPVVATDVGGVGEALAHEVSGYLVAPPDDGRADGRGVAAAELVRRVSALLDDPSLRARMGAAGSACVRRGFTADSAAEATIAAYEACRRSGDSEKKGA